MREACNGFFEGNNHEGSIPFTRSNFAAHSAATVSQVGSSLKPPIYNRTYNTFTVLYSCLTLFGPPFRTSRREPATENPVSPKVAVPSPHIAHELPQRNRDRQHHAQFFRPAFCEPDSSRRTFST